MNSVRFSIRLGWGTLRSRPTLTLLAVLLLGLGVSVAAVLLCARQVISNARSELFSSPTIELELTQAEPVIYTEVMERVEEWPAVESILYRSPEQVLREIESEAGDSLWAVLGTNPFPPLIRVQFTALDTSQIDRLVNLARQWAEVSAVSSPKQVWVDLDRLIIRVDRWLYQLALPLVLVTLGLTALCLRAQVRNRTRAWEFLALLGLSRTSLQTAFLTQQLIVGVLSGLIACGVLYAARRGFEWLLLREIVLPLVTFAVVFLSSVVLALLSGLFSRPTKI